MHLFQTSLCMPARFVAYYDKHCQRCSQSDSGVKHCYLCIRSGEQWGRQDAGA